VLLAAAINLGAASQAVLCVITCIAVPDSSPAVLASLVAIYGYQILLLVVKSDFKSDPYHEERMRGVRKHLKR
jgi:hypothetical protein